MKRSTFITWDQLKVGAMILVAMIIAGIAVLRLGQAANLFSRRYSLVTYVPSTAGLRVGGQVTLAGQLAGTVKSIDFLPVDADTMRNLRITVEIARDLQSQVRKDSKARLKTQGLLGDKVFDISPGTPRFAPLRDGETLPLAAALDYEQVLVQASGALDEVVFLTGTLQKVADGVSAGEGTLGQLFTNRSLHDQLNSTLASTNSLMLRLQSPRGTVGRLLDDPSVYQSLNRVLLSADTLVGQLGAGVNSDSGSIGKLLRDDELYTRLLSAVAGVDTIVGTMSRGRGTVNKLFTDEQLYAEILKAVSSLNAVLVDARRDPRRYTKGLIRVF